MEHMGEENIKVLMKVRLVGKRENIFGSMVNTVCF